MKLISAEIYPAFEARYYSLYIQGLISHLGSSRLTYTTRGFPRFGSDCLAVRLRNDEEERKIYIHSNDMPELNEEGLAWCDLFGKVNLDRELVPGPAWEKVLGLGPTMGVRVWGPIRSHAMALMNLWRCRSVIGDHWREHIASYRGQYASRFPEEIYRPGTARPDYIFYNAALWEREPEANSTRARFVEACRSVDGAHFEGGLTPRQSARGIRNYSAPEFAPFLGRRYSPREYLERTRVSAVAMNNPAYRDCHSWRLAECLALGKAILSLPIVRALPAPLEHGVHIHYVEDSVASFRSGIERILGDENYRKKLETNARAYYETYLSPRSVMARIFHESRVRSRFSSPPGGSGDE